MGTACACVASDIFICNFVEKNLFTTLFTPKLYKQYRDDSFGIWLHGAESLNNYLKHINTLHDKIKFTLTFGKTIEYLDLKISLTEWGTVSTETHYKQTDTFQTLHYSSNHPNHIKNNIPKSQIIRHIRNCTFPQTLRLHTLHLCMNLLKRGYPRKLILHKTTHHNIKRLNAIKYKNKKRPLAKIPLIVTFHSTIPNLNRVLKTQAKKLTSITPIEPLLGFNLEKSLSKHIIRAKFNELVHES
jgi:hypothetical protein